MPIMEKRLSKAYISGFTFVELVIVVMLLSTLSIMVARPLSNFSEYEFHLDLKRLETALGYARLLAIQSGCDIRVSADNRFNRESGANQFDLKLSYVNTDCHRDGDSDVYNPATLERYRIQFSGLMGIVSEDFSYSRKTVFVPSRPEGFELTYYGDGAVCNPEGDGVEIIRIGNAITDSRSDIKAMEVKATYRIECKTAYMTKLT